jgi:hypothetical protein
MKLVLNRAVVLEILDAMDASENKFRVKLSLVGARRGHRVIIESLGQSGQPEASVSEPRTTIGEMVFHPAGMYWLKPSEKRRVAELLKQKEELAFVVAEVSSCGDPAFFPVYFSRQFPQGLDMALTCDGVTVRQDRSALKSPAEQTKHRRLGFKHHSRNRPRRRKHG